MGLRLCAEYSMEVRAGSPVMTPSQYSPWRRAGQPFGIAVSGTGLDST